MVLLSLAFIACGLLFVALAVPLLQRRIAPNGWYGFRVPRTLDNADRWYAVNAYAARYLIWGGVATAVIACVGFLPGISVDLYLWLMTVVVLIGPLVSLVLGLRYLRTLP